MDIEEKKEYKLGNTLRRRKIQDVKKKKKNICKSHPKVSYKGQLNSY